MVRKYAVIFLVGLFLASCAQVGVITGGDKDIHAPKPVADHVSPPNESTNFSDKSVEIPFDEYFQLISPVQNIRMIPPHATIDAKVKGKSLFLSWEEDLEPNTTYAIYLTNAIKDLTEGNDTIMQYVFSTGGVLDTLSYTVGVIDAFTNEPIDDCVVALYQPMSNKLVSFAEANNGLAELKYLRPGEYRMVAFVDENNDLELQDYEQVAFPDGGKITVKDSSYFDSIPLRMYAPETAPKIESVEQLSNCLFEFTVSENFGKVVRSSANGDVIPIKQTRWDGNGTFYFHYDPGTSSSIEFILHGETFSDTINKRLKDMKGFNLKKLDRTPLKLSEGGEKTFVSVTSNYWMKGAENFKDSSKVYMISKDDSSRVNLVKAVPGGKMASLFFNLESPGDYTLVFEEGVIQSECDGPSPKTELDLTVLEASDYGSINVDLSHYNKPILVQLIRRNEVITTINARKTIGVSTFEDLLPGEYTFKVIHDTNDNQKWDIGNYSELKQPERVDYYTKKIKVRANWSIDVTLTPTD